jgi:hypothetical protein
VGAGALSADGLAPGATFINGKLVERPGENTEPEAA